MKKEITEMKEITTKIMDVTGRSAEECEKINKVLNSHFLIGHNQKDKIVNDFCSALGIDAAEADELYNQCMEIIVKGIFKR